MCKKCDDAWDKYCKVKEAALKKYHAVMIKCSDDKSKVPCQTYNKVCGNWIVEEVE